MPVMANEAKPNLKTQAVTLAARTDAHNMYCDKKSTLTTDFINKFIETEQINTEETTRLRALHQLEYNKTITHLKQDAKPCEDLEFMLKRLQIMRKLKDISYQLNGVKKQDIPPDNIPDIDGLLPPRSSEL